ncbi:MAG: hypothetical protein J6W70_01720, partial [Lentisphaeria bacterium]|nr:hypothetical protein [Lentisphaeria bacterium]
EKFKAAGNKNIILDLRDNGGGYMDIMQALSARFIEAKTGVRSVVSVGSNSSNILRFNRKIKRFPAFFRKCVPPGARHSSDSASTSA